MKKTLGTAIAAGVACALLLHAAIVSGYLDFALRGAPASPAGGYGRVGYFGSGLTGVLTCTRSDASSCMPSSSVVYNSASDPGCAAGGDIGKLWLDTTSAVTSHFKVCAEVASSPTWVVVF